MLVPLDSNVTALTFVNSMPAQIARGSVIEDADGPRQATLLIPPATGAQLRMHDGTTKPMPMLSVRATEYTVGDNGRERMPAPLPPTSAYTYAVEFSADEALDVNAKSVEFDRPLAFYLDNFLDFPVGSNIPAGYYDARLASWLPSDNGRVVEILSVVGGLVALDVDGSGIAADDTLLNAIGITATERQQLAGLYTPGKTLWRTPVQHFTPWDCNTPLVPGDDDEPPPEPEDDDDTNSDEYDPIIDPPCDGIGDCIDGDADNNAPDDADDTLEDGETECGSLIRCEESSLQEFLPIAGTNLSLAYSSKRVPGRTFDKNLRVRVSGASVPGSLKRAEVSISTLGLRQVKTFQDLEPNTFFNGDVPRYDAYGRLWNSAAYWVVRVAYWYPVYNATDNAQFDRAWSQYRQSGVGVLGNASAREYALTRTWTTRANHTVYRPVPGAWDVRGQGLGGWTIGVQHVLDADRKMVLRGDGGDQQLDSHGVQGVSVVKTLLKTQAHGTLADAARSGFAPDGTAYVLTGAMNPGLWRYDAQGIPQRLSEKLCTSDDPTCVYKVPQDIAVDDRGRVYVAVRTQVVDVSVFGEVREVFDSKKHDLTCSPERLAAWRDRIYVLCGDSVFAIWRDGQVTHLAGGGASPDDALPPQERDFGNITEIAVDAQGNLYIYSHSKQTLFRVRFDGRVETILGDGTDGYSPDGSQANGSAFGSALGMAVRENGAILLAEATSERIRELRPDGRLYTIAGGGTESPLPGAAGAGGLSRQLSALARDVRVMPDGSVSFLPYMPVASRRTGADLPANLAKSLTLPSAPVVIANSLHVSTEGYGAKPDGTYRIADRAGTEEYLFDHDGRHLTTRDAVSGAVLHSFEYDDDGYPLAIVDGDGNRIEIERDAAQRVTAFVAPDGQRTQLAYNADGFLSRIEDPLERTWKMEYQGASGLLTRFETPRGYASEFAWANDGKLASDINAEGGGWNITRTRWASKRATETTFTTAMGRTNRFLVREIGNHTQQRRIARAGAPERTSAVAEKGQLVRHGPSGVTSRRGFAPDPRFGWDAPYDSYLSVRIDGGNSVLERLIKRKLEAEPTKEGSGAGDFDLLETTTINGDARTYTRSYDAATRTWVVLSPEGRSATIRLDGRGRTDRIEVPGLAPVRYVYDDRGRLVATEAGEGETLRRTDLGYDANGWLASVVDPDARTTNLEHDLIGRLRRQTLPDAREIQFRHDANRNLVGITPPGRPEHVFDYDKIDQLKRYLAPEAMANEPRETLYTRSLDKQLTQVLRPDGRTIDRTYDAVTGHLTAIASTERGIQPITTNSDGQPIAATRLGFKWAGPLLREQHTHLPTGGADAQRLLRYSYNNELHLAKLELRKPDDTVLGSAAYEYDNDGLLAKLTVGAFPQTYAYDPDNGLLQSVTLDELVETWTWTQFAEPASVVTTWNDNTRLGFAYTRDSLGRINAVVETADGISRTSEYTYDLAGRLHTVQRDGEPLATYTYDANSNRTGTTYAGAWAAALTACATDAPITADIDAQDRLLRYGTCEYAYNANGELEAKLDTATNDATSYRYDEFGNLLKVNLPNGDALEYVIDGLNRRIGKKRNGTVERTWLYANQLEPVAEFDGDGNLVARYAYGEKAHVPTLMVKGDKTYKIVSDHLGSVRQVIDALSGEAVQAMDYDAWATSCRTPTLASSRSATPAACTTRIPDSCASGHGTTIQ